MLREHFSLSILVHCRSLSGPCKSFPCADKTNGNFGVNGGVPWLTNIAVLLNFVFFYKDSVDDVSHFLVDCPRIKDNFESLRSNLSQKIISLPAQTCFNH